MKEALMWCAGLFAVIFLVVYVGGAVISAQPRVWATDGVIEDVPAGTPSAELALTIRFQPTGRVGWGPSGGLLPEGYEWGSMPTLRAEVRSVGRGSRGMLTPECHTRYRASVCQWTTHVRVYNHTTQIEVRILHHRYSGWEPVFTRMHTILGPEGGLFDRGRLDVGRAHQHVDGGIVRGFYWIRAEDLRPNP